MVEFISYNGEYPNLCTGTLIIKVNGKLYEFADALISGGNCFIDGDFDEVVEYGDWCLSDYVYEKYPELEQYYKEIEKVVNDNVEKCCCGGCL